MAQVTGSPVQSYADQVGGMSPGCATRVLCEDGARVFVKSVGSELNPDTPALFRREVMALGLLGSSPRWADLLASTEQDGWITIVLEDVEGRHARLDDDAEMEHLCGATDELSLILAERVPDPPEAGDFFGGGLVDLAAGFRKWAQGLHLARSLAGSGAEEYAALVPPWIRAAAGEWAERVAVLGDCAAPQLQHWDIRNDNLLVRPTGELVFVDWGTTAVGPGWADPLLARLERVDDPWFDRAVHTSPALRAAGDDVITAFLVGFGTWLAYRAVTAADHNLPTLREFRQQESRRTLTAAARRLGRDPGDLGGPAERG